MVSPSRLSLGGITGFCGFPLALGVGIAVTLLALAAQALDARGLYDGAGAGLHGGLEALGVALLIGSRGELESLGFLALVPYAWVAARRRAGGGAGAFAVAFALVGAWAMIHRAEQSIPSASTTVSWSPSRTWVAARITGASTDTPGTLRAARMTAGSMPP